MSNREKCLAIIDSFTEAQLGNIAAMLQAAKDAIVEAADDAFCVALYEEYQQDPDKGEAVSLEEAAAALALEADMDAIIADNLPAFKELAK